MTGTFTVRIEPDGVEATGGRGELLSAVLERIRLAINYPCGACATCGNCRVKFVSGAPAPSWSDRELVSEGELQQGVRLACSAEIEADCIIEIPPGTRQIEPVILTTAAGREAPLAPRARKVFLQVPEATVERPDSDEEIVRRLLRASVESEPRAPLDYLRELPRALREGAREVTLTVCADQIVDVEAGTTQEALYGVALDIGTTTVAASLHSLRNGKQLGVAARLNPQVDFGADVVARLTYVYGSCDRLNRMNEKIIGCVNELLARLCQEANVSSRNVVLLTVAGNAAMNHLFLRVPPEQIAIAPYTPVFREAPPARASALQLNLPRARVEVLPNIGGFVGGDTVAGLLACDFLNQTEPRLFIDIGTNCEVVLGVGEKLFAASAPAGPALEGGCISCGMRAEAGAIHDIEVIANALQIQTIGNTPARGLCGSGLLHLADTLKRMGALHHGGLFADPETLPGDLRHRLKIRDGGKRAFLVASINEGAERDIWLTQNDVRELQLAKAAISSTWQTLCAEAGVVPEEITAIYLAGAFGNYVRADAALHLGLVPSCSIERLRAVGNTALEGARLVLLNQEFALETKRILDVTRFVELAGREDFQETFAMELAL